MNPDLQRRLRALGDALDGVAHAEQMRRHGAVPVADVVDLQAAAAARRPSPRYPLVVAVAAATVAVLTGALIAVTRIQTPPSTGARPDAIAAVASTEPATTEPAHTTDPTTTTSTTTTSTTTTSTTTNPTTTNPSTTNPTTTNPSTTNAPRPSPTGGVASQERTTTCQRYTSKDTFHFRRCDKGALVTLIQERLAASGADVDVDGHYGPDTEAAVKSFQREHGLQVDGQVGPETWSVLVPDVPAPMPPETESSNTPGSHPR